MGCVLGTLYPPCPTFFTGKRKYTKQRGNGKKAVTTEEDRKDDVPPPSTIVGEDEVVVEVQEEVQQMVHAELRQEVRSYRPDEGAEEEEDNDVADEYNVQETLKLLAGQITHEEKTDFKDAFDEVADKDGEVDAYQLKEILNAAFKRDFEFSGFNIDMCRSMVASRDQDLSGQLGFDECEEMWNDILIWRNAFKELDTDSNGYIEAEQLELVISHLGIKLKPKTIEALVTRYSDKENHIYFEDFISCMIKLKSMLEVYQDQKSSLAGRKATFSLEEFIQMTIYC